MVLGIRVPGSSPAIPTKGNTNGKQLKQVNDLSSESTEGHGTWHLKSILENAQHSRAERRVARGVPREGGVDTGPVAVGVGRAVLHPLLVQQRLCGVHFVSPADADNWPPEIVLVFVPPRLQFTREF